MVIIKLVRHGESEANVGRVSSSEIGDHTIPLSELGHEQAREAGTSIGNEFLSGALIYVSPYRRTRATLAEVFVGAGMTAEDAARVYEDPRLREVEHGYEDVRAQSELRARHGWFYYRFRGGESPADCYDRASNFLESMMRQIERKRKSHVLLVTHGLFIRCFVMRFLHLSVEDFDRMDNPKNCDVITLADRTTIEAPVFASGRWAVDGIRQRAATDS